MILASASLLAIARLVHIQEGHSQLYVYLGACSEICHLCQKTFDQLFTVSSFVILWSFFFIPSVFVSISFAVMSSTSERTPSSTTTVVICAGLYAPLRVIAESRYEGVSLAYCKSSHLSAHAACESIGSCRFLAVECRRILKERVSRATRHDCKFFNEFTCRIAHVAVAKILRTLLAFDQFRISSALSTFIQSEINSK
ncbi:hypothetical protein PRIPAC_82798, partial [Pristionchus pacificus]|uniref:Uncharacterized protein n=1 Tax=Pristionchus pacificus TaxID=54126 RepID=A0A2A6CLP4_PRIPA